MSFTFTDQIEGVAFDFPQQHGSNKRRTMQIQPALLEAVARICRDLEPNKEQAFWSGLEAVVRKFGQRNRELLQRRDEMQQKIDNWHKSHPQIPAARLGEHTDYICFLKEIGYLLPEPDKVEVSTPNVDPEIGTLAGPQLVCPIDKARFVVNSCNARWGSLFDAVYSSNILGQIPRGPWSKARAMATFAYVDDFLTEIFPLDHGDWRSATSFCVHNGELLIKSATVGSPCQPWICDAQNNVNQDFRSKQVQVFRLHTQDQFVGYVGDAAAPQRLLLKQNGLHVEVNLDRCSKLGQCHHAGISDVICESAVTAILDMEDSVAVVDADDKAACYTNLAGVMRGDLQTDLGGGRVRRLAGPRGPYKSPRGIADFTLPGQALMLVRNVGLSMYTDMVMVDGEEIPEHFVDAMATALCACHDFHRHEAERNSQTGSVYIVKPKMHGPEEVAMVVEMFADIERALELQPLTLKIGVMDEERRTTVNLQACISVAAERICFINTGFMDRVGDEIHTSMALGPAFPKAQIKAQPFFQAYEDQNVNCGLLAKFGGHAQIGKGMIE